MMREILIRFAAGGLIVCVFAAIGDVLKPKSFRRTVWCRSIYRAGDIGSDSEGIPYATIEARSRIAGALGFLGYSLCVSYIMTHYQLRCYVITVLSIPLWFAIAFGTWAVWIRH